MQFSKHTLVYLLLHIVTHTFYQVYFEELNAHIKFEGLNASLFYSCGAFNFTNGITKQALILVEKLKFLGCKSTSYDVYYVNFTRYCRCSEFSENLKLSRNGV